MEPQPSLLGCLHAIEPIPAGKDADLERPPPLRTGASPALLGPTGQAGSSRKPGRARKSLVGPLPESMLLPERLLIVDTETTDLDPQRGRCI